MVNNGLPECYLNSKCELICKDEEGNYELPGKQLSQKECYDYGKYLEQWFAAGTDGGTSREKGGLGFDLGLNLPRFALLDSFAKWLAEATGLDFDKYKDIFKAIAIIAVILAALLLINILKK